MVPWEAILILKTLLGSLPENPDLIAQYLVQVEIQCV